MRKVSDTKWSGIRKTTSLFSLKCANLHNIFHCIFKWSEIYISIWLSSLFHYVITIKYIYNFFSRKSKNTWYFQTYQELPVWNNNNTVSNYWKYDIDNFCSSPCISSHFFKLVKYYAITTEFLKNCDLRAKNLFQSMLDENRK